MSIFCSLSFPTSSFLPFSFFILRSVIVCFISFPLLPPCLPLLLSLWLNFLPSWSSYCLLYIFSTFFPLHSYRPLLSSIIFFPLHLLCFYIAFPFFLSSQPAHYSCTSYKILITNTVSHSSFPFTSRQCDIDFLALLYFCLSFQPFTETFHG